MDLYDAERPCNNLERENKILANLQKSIERNRKKLLKKAEQLDHKNGSVDMTDVEHKNSGEVETEAIPDDMECDNMEIQSNEIDKGSSFVVLGNDKFDTAAKVDMTLPPWLAYPTVISNDLSVESTTSITDLSYINNDIKNTLTTKMGITKLFPVQTAVIDWILNANKKPTPFRPRDICVSAPTGSGKTLAYAIPIVQMLSSRIERKVRALIVLPVNELGLQVLKVFHKLCEATRLSCVLLTKFTPFETEQSSLVGQCDQEYYSKADIVIATTGRLVEHIHATKGFSLKSLKFLVMDEADRIMEQIQSNWLYHLDRHVREESDNILSGQSFQLCYRDLCNVCVKQPQKMLFSATLSQDPEKLQDLRLFQPKLFTSIVGSLIPSNDYHSTTRNVCGDFVGKFTTPAELTENFCITEEKLKPLTLYSLIKENNWNRFLCFTNSGDTAHRLSFFLQELFGKEMKIEELSSGLPPMVRKSVLEKFKQAKVNGLVCSDSLARGIDIEGVDIVISYNVPRHIKTYIHPRAGRRGLAVTLATNDELKFFNSIIKEAGKSDIKEIKVTSDIEEMSVKEFKTVVQKLQISLKREKQLQSMKAIHEKNKSRPIGSGLLGQLQSQLITSNQNSVKDDENLPESWKTQNQLARKILQLVCGTFGSVKAGMSKNPTSSKSDEDSLLEFEFANEKPTPIEVDEEGLENTLLEEEIANISNITANLGLEFEVLQKDSASVEQATTSTPISRNATEANNNIHQQPSITKRHREVSEEESNNSTTLIRGPPAKKLRKVTVAPPPVTVNAKPPPPQVVRLIPDLEEVHLFSKPHLETLHKSVLKTLKECKNPNVKYEFCDRDRGRYKFVCPNEEAKSFALDIVPLLKGLWPDPKIKAVNFGAAPKMRKLSGAFQPIKSKYFSYNKL
ncbi:putative ATP-dependent RNA helicase Dbp73D [Pseudolycoriella hygida]|uniref:ATP-dependent RNA helicase n=1 Tax=Pseudolycoriella hygida TaxID=35572 RepID=A0A9Q0S2Z4_9DIPT|nr:putative ATP-dependent RNA helicase Dbp73D [Pseudolycoriella hygida]